MRHYTIFILTAILLVIGACTPYPRYSSAPVMPIKDVDPIEPRLSTAEYIRLGLIVQSYLGKPYAGTSKYDPGVDCSAFTQEVFRKFNQTILPRTAEAQFHEGRAVPDTRIKLGDLVFFRTDHSGISHVGIAISQQEFIHSSSSKGVIISNRYEDYWARRFAGARRIIE